MAASPRSDQSLKRRSGRQLSAGARRRHLIGPAHRRRCALSQAGQCSPRRDFSDGRDHRAHGQHVRRPNGRQAWLGADKPRRALANGRPGRRGKRLALPPMPWAPVHASAVVRSSKEVAAAAAAAPSAAAVEPRAPGPGPAEVTVDRGEQGAVRGGVDSAKGANPPRPICPASSRVACAPTTTLRTLACVRCARLPLEGGLASTHAQGSVAAFASDAFRGQGEGRGAAAQATLRRPRIELGDPFDDAVFGGNGEGEVEGEGAEGADGGRGGGIGGADRALDVATSGAYRSLADVGLGGHLDSLHGGGRAQEQDLGRRPSGRDGSCSSNDAVAPKTPPSACASCSDDDGCLGSPEMPFCLQHVAGWRAAGWSRAGRWRRRAARCILHLEARAAARQSHSRCARREEERLAGGYEHLTAVGAHALRYDDQAYSSLGSSSSDPLEAPGGAPAQEPRRAPRMIAREQGALSHAREPLSGAPSSARRIRPVVGELTPGCSCPSSRAHRGGKQRASVSDRFSAVADAFDSGADGGFADENGAAVNGTPQQPGRAAGLVSPPPPDGCLPGLANLGNVLRQRHPPVPVGGVVARPSPHGALRRATGDRL